jgi:hypothetical protein
MSEVYETRAVCTTIVDEILEEQLAAAEAEAPIELRPGQVCSTVVDELLEGQLG